MQMCFLEQVNGILSTDPNFSTRNHAKNLGILRQYKMQEPRFAKTPFGLLQTLLPDTVTFFFVPSLFILTPSNFLGYQHISFEVVLP